MAGLDQYQTALTTLFKRGVLELYFVEVRSISERSVDVDIDMDRGSGFKRGNVEEMWREGRSYDGVPFYL